VFQINVVEKIEAHILCSVTFFYFENRAVYEIMWKNIEERCWPQMILWHLRIACRTPRATNTRSDCVILTAFPLQQWLQEHASMSRYIYIVGVTFFLHVTQTNHI
jgi:hypothetical protein